MIKKITFAILLFASFSVFAAKEGLFVRYNVEIESSAETMRGTADYYYQGGDFLSITNFGESMMGEAVYLEKDGRKYSLFPKEKTYVETKEFAASPFMFHPVTEGSYVATGIKKKILGYKCEIFTKDSKTMTTNVCLGQKLYTNWGTVVTKMESSEQAAGIPKGFPLEIVTINKVTKKQTVATMSAIRQKDYQKKFDIMNDYKKKEGADVQKNSTEMIKGMPSTVPMDQGQFNKMEKMTNEMNKKYKPEQ